MSTKTIAGKPRSAGFVIACHLPSSQMTDVYPELLLIDPVQRPAARRYLVRIDHLKHGTACYHCAAALVRGRVNAEVRDSGRCPSCAAPIDHRRYGGNRSTKPELWVEIAAYMLEGMSDAEIGRRLAWSKAAALCRRALLQIMQETEPELAQWWHAHIERDQPVLPAHLRCELEAARAAIAAGHGPLPFGGRGEPICTDIPVAVLEAIVLGRSDCEIVERYAVSRAIVQSRWRPALQAWLAEAWPALGAWAECCRNQRRRAQNRASQLRQVARDSSGAGDVGVAGS